MTVTSPALESQSIGVPPLTQGPGLLLSNDLPSVLTDKLSLVEVPVSEDCPALALDLANSQVRTGTSLDHTVRTERWLAGAGIVTLQDGIVVEDVLYPVVRVLLAGHHQVTAVVSTICLAVTSCRYLTEQVPAEGLYTLLYLKPYRSQPTPGRLRGLYMRSGEVWL